MQKMNDTLHHAVRSMHKVRLIYGNLSSICRGCRIQLMMLIDRDHHMEIA
jgi:hypothetical protein